MNNNTWRLFDTFSFVVCRWARRVMCFETRGCLGQCAVHYIITYHLIDTFVFESLPWWIASERWYAMSSTE